MSEEAFRNRVGSDRISSRQIDELIGLARGMTADGAINHAEAEFLQTWLAANGSITDQPLIRDLFMRISEMLSDGVFSESESHELLETLHSFTGAQTEFGEVLKSTVLPLCNPPPTVEFLDRRFAFTGTFQFGQRRACEKAVFERGGDAGGITKNTDFLVIGVYATESWKHSSMGNKILRACELRDNGCPISIISETHWTKHL